MIDLKYIFRLTEKATGSIPRDVTMTLHENKGAVINLNCDTDNSIALKAEGTSILGRPYVSTLSHSLFQYKEAIRNVYLSLITHTDNIADLQVDSKINGVHLVLDNSILSNTNSKYSPMNVKVVDVDVEGVDYYFIESSNALQKNTYRKKTLNIVAGNFKPDVGLYTDLMCLLSKCEFPNMKIVFNTKDNIKFINKNTKMAFTLEDDLSFLTDAEFNLLYMVYSYTLATGGKKIKAGSSSLIIQFINMKIFEGLIDYQYAVLNEITRLEREKEDSVETSRTDFDKLNRHTNESKLGDAQLGEVALLHNNNTAMLASIKTKNKTKDLTQGGKYNNQLVTALDGIIDIMKMGNVLIHIYNIPENYTGKYKKKSKVMGVQNIDFSSMDEDAIVNTDIGNNIVANYTDWELPTIPPIESKE